MSPDARLEVVLIVGSALLLTAWFALIAYGLICLAEWAFRRLWED